MREGELDIRAGQPHSARIYDYYLGGKDNFPADREVAEQILALAPESRDNVQINRSFLRRAVRYLAGEAGIRQFLDIGAGLPTQGNVHEIAQEVAPDAHVVYVDNDPIVVTHGRALLARDHVVIVQGDLREPERILDQPELRRELDLGQPIGLLVVFILHFVGDHEDPAGLIGRLRDAMAPGSYLVISHATAELDRERGTKAEEIYKAGTMPLTLRDRAQVERLFDGFELVDPGVVEVHRWRPDDDTWAHAGQVPIYGGIGYLPSGSASPP